MKNSLALLLAGCFSLVWMACHHPEPTMTATHSNINPIDSLPGTCPYLTRDNKGNIVLSWIRGINDSSAIFCYAVSVNGGKTFGQPIIVPASNNVHPHAENIPKVIFKPSGEIIAIWGAANAHPKNKYAGIVYYAQSFDEGKHWSDAKPIVNDAAGFDQRYFDVALLPGGEVAITWLDNRKTIHQEGSGLYFAVTNGPDGFAQERLVQQQCCQCCRTDLFVDSKGNIHILYRGIINDSIRDMVHTVSVDAGKSFTAPQRISNDNWVINGCPHTGPTMTENKGVLNFAWYTGGSRKGSFFTRSTDNGKSFEARDGISFRGSHPQMASLSNGELAIVWDETFPVEGQLRSRIGIQRRSQAGKMMQDIFIAEDSLQVTYPVITETINQHTLVAFCQQRGGKRYVVYSEN